jgi:hypothetical protein
MDVDASFAEYVAARWSTLYRLAVLLVGEPGADDLTQAALVRAYLVWPEVQESGSADDRVKRILATTAARGTKAGGDGPGGTGPGTGLWASITALPPRQRAVLVLRHYETFTDAEIAGVVKASTSAVTAEAGALETGIDLADLRGELTRRAEEAAVPLPPIDQLFAQSHRARRQRTRRSVGRLATAAVAVVTALAVVAAIQSWTSDPPRPSRPGPSATELPRFLSSLPRGAVPTFPYSVRRFLYLPGGRGVDLEERPAAIVDTPQWVYVAYLSGKIVRVDTTTLRVEPVVETSGGQLVDDPRGERVAWLTAAAEQAAVDLTTLDGSDPAGERQDFPVMLRCCDNPFEVNGITEDGELIASLPAESRVWVWDTTRGGGVRELSGIGNGVVSQVTVRGLVVHYPPLEYAVGRIQDGAFLQVAELAVRKADFSDPLGVRAVHTDEAGEIDVRDFAARGRSRRAGPSVRLRLPALEEGFAAVRWEDDDHVVLDVFDESAPDGALVRCDARDGSCELADELEGPHLLAR